MGFTVCALEAYRRDDASWGAEDTETLQFALREGASWYLTSSEAVEALVQRVHDLCNVSGIDVLLSQTVVVTHSAILQAAKSAGFRDCHLIEPGADALRHWLESVA